MNLDIRQGASQKGLALGAKFKPIAFQANSFQHGSQGTMERAFSPCLIPVVNSNPGACAPGWFRAGLRPLRFRNGRLRALKAGYYHSPGCKPQNVSAESAGNISLGRKPLVGENNRERRAESPIHGAQNQRL